MKESLKKDMIVNLEDNTIFIPQIGLIDIDVICDAYERIQQRRGIESAQDKGVHMGRPTEEVPEEFVYYYDLVKAGVLSATYAAYQMKISRSTFYRYKKKHESCK